MTNLNWTSIVGRELLAASNKAAKVQENWHNGTATDALADTAIETVEALAKKLGLKTLWPGLYPVFQNAEGRQFHLPD